MRQALWKVGELASRTGLTVRTLHYYDEIGLLSPPQRTDSGHRLYAADDVVRLQQIKSLRQLGFPLEEISGVLSRPESSPRSVLGMHIARLKEQIELQQRLCKRMEAIAARLDGKEQVFVEEFLLAIEEMDRVEKYDKYYTPKQREYLEERAQVVGEERIRQAEGEWKQLIAEVRSEMDKGTDPTSQPVLLLARRWRSLIDEFTGGDAGIERTVGTVWKQEPSLGERCGLDSAMFQYIGQAMDAVKSSD